MAVKAATAYVDFQGDFTSLNKQLDAVLGPITGKFGKLGKAATVGLAGVTVGAGLAGKALYDIGASFDEAYDTIRVGTGKTGKQLDGLKQSFRDVVKLVPTDFATAGDAITKVNQRLGASGPMLTQITRRFLELSRITETDVSTNIEQVSRAFGDWGIKTQQQTVYMDKLFRASQATGVPVADLASTVTKFGGPLRQLGFGFDQAAAMAAKFEKEGVNTELVMGSLRIALGRMASEGVKDPVKALETITDRIQGAGSAGKANALALEFFGARAGPDMAAAIREGRFELGDLMDTISNGSDNIIKAGQDTQDFGEKWQLLKNRVLVALEPIAMRVFDAIGKGMDFISRIDLSGVIGWFKNLARAFSGAGDESGLLGKTLAVLGDAFDALKETIAAAVEIGQAIWAKFGDLIVERAKILAHTFQEVFGGIIEALRGVVQFITAVFSGDWGRAWDGIKRIFTGAWQAIQGALKGALDLLLNTLKIALRAIETVVSGVWDAIKQAAGNAWGAIKDVILAPVRIARDVLSEVWGAIRDRAAGVWQGLRETASNVWGNVKEAVLGPIRAARDVLADIWDAIKDRAKGAFDRIVGFAGGFAGAVKDAVVSAFEGVVNTVIGFINTIIGVINKIPGVEIGKIKALAQGGVMGPRGVTGDVQALARGGIVKNPTVIVGEEAPRHPEFVIPTNPAYRKRAIGLYDQLGKQLGVHGDHNDRMGGLADDASGFGPLGTAVDSELLDILTKGSKGLIGMLPGVGALPSWLQGMGRAVLEKAAAYIKDQITNLIGTASDIVRLDVVEKLAASKFGLMVMSGFRPGDDGWHGQNRARDFGGSAGAMQSFAAFMLGLAPRLLELIHTPLGVGVKNGQVVPISFFGPEVMADHFDHVHVAMARGGILHRDGWVLDSYQQGTDYVPKTGPYLLHQGEQVIPAGSQPVIENHLYIDGREIEIVAERVVHRSNRQLALGMRAR